MRCRLTLQLALLGTIFPMLSCPPVRAQLPRGLEKCLPYPTLAEEIRQMQEEIKQMQGETPRPRVTIDTVTFQGAIHLPKPSTAQVAARFEHATFDRDSSWLEALQEAVTDAWQQHGYFYAKVSAQTRVLSGDSTDQRVSVTVHVDDGVQYRLAEIRFTKAKEFPPAEMRKQFSLPNGDVFDIQRIREGMQALTRLYGTHGYIDFVASPEIQVDNAHQRISVIMEVQEGKQFRVGSVEVLGLDQKIVDSALKTGLKPGDLFNRNMVEEFFKENKAVLPPRCVVRG